MSGSLQLTSALPEPGSPAGTPNGAHSYDPGIFSTGVLWTIPIPEASISVNLGAGSAVIEARNIPLGEVFTVDNSFSEGVARLPAVFEFLRIEWGGITNRIQFSDATDQFSGTFLENSATIEVTATTRPSGSLHGFRFVSAATTASLFAQTGHEHNGSFFTG